MHESLGNFDSLRMRTRQKGDGLDKGGKLARAEPPSSYRAQAAIRCAAALHIGPLIPPSLRTLQKWIMIRSAAASGIATQWST